MSQLLLSLIFVVVPGLYAENFGANLHPQAPPQSSALADANTALEAHDFALALTLLQPLAAANPTDAHILYDLGSAQDALDQTAPATATYRQAIAAQPLYFEPHLALGLLLARNAELPRRPHRTRRSRHPAGRPGDEGCRLPLARPSRRAVPVRPTPATSCSRH